MRRATRFSGIFGGYDTHYYLGLAAALSAEDQAQAGLLALLEQQISEIGKWIERGAGANFCHKHLLLKAEAARLRLELPAAGTYYERAIEAAAEGGFTNDQALANERASLFYRARGLEKVAWVYLQEAYYCYEKWGASAKVADLARRHPELAPPSTGSLSATGEYARASRTTTTDSSSELDLLAVLKVSQQLSGEMELDVLLQNSLQIIIQNSGAQRGFLLLARADGLFVEAAGEAGDVTDASSIPLDQRRDLAAGIARYVARTHETVILEDAANEGIFRADPYVAGNRVRSLACLPLLTHGRLVGLIYLENSLTVAAFSAARLEVVRLLTAGAAVSIESARLYSELQRSHEALAEYSHTLEQRVEERTRDLAEKTEQIEASLRQQQAMQDQLLLSEKMASLGNLVAGVAHEINTPIGAVIGSVDTSLRALEKLSSLLAEEGVIVAGKRKARTARLIGMLGDNLGVIDMAGARVGDIVRTLRSFARLDDATAAPRPLASPDRRPERLLP